MVEIEKKAKINNREEIKDYLDKNARFVKNQYKEDIYFAEAVNDVDFDFEKHKMFRMRLVEDHYEITFKTKRIEKGFEINDESEFNIQIKDKDEFVKFIEFINFKEVIKKFKTTLLYEYKGTKLELNHIEKLGDYVEIEILAEDECNVDLAFRKINEIFNELNIKESQIETKYYTQMLLELSK